MSGNEIETMRADLAQYVEDIQEFLAKDITVGWQIYPFIESYLSEHEDLVEELIVQFDKCKLQEMSTILATIILKRRAYLPAYEMLRSLGKSHETLAFLYDGVDELVSKGIISGK